jgi:hypothetical protein
MRAGKRRKRLELSAADPVIAVRGGRMDSSDLIMQVGSMFIGGSVGAFGVRFLVRRSAARSFIGRWPWWGLLLYYVAVAGVVLGGFFWILRMVLANPDAGGPLDSPWLFLGFGVIVGLPFTLTTVTGVWRDARDAKLRGKKTKTKPATRQERLAFAQDLQRQLREFADRDRHVEVGLRGEKGGVLLLQGDLSRQEGERLVKALRADLQALNFQRVEGEGEQGKWWAPVQEGP